MALTSKSESAQLSVSLERWVADYSRDAPTAIAELLTFLVEASGLPGATLDLDSVHGEAEDGLTDLLTDQTCADLVENAKELAGRARPSRLAFIANTHTPRLSRPYARSPLRTPPPLLLSLDAPAHASARRQPRQRRTTSSNPTQSPTRKPGKSTERICCTSLAPSWRS